MPPTETFTVDPASEGQRLDLFLVDRITEVSRTRIRIAITGGQVTVDGRSAKPSYKVIAGEVIVCSLEKAIVDGPIPEEIPLDILYDDPDIAVINKPPGMVVHPSKGHWQGTLTSALAFHFQKLSGHGGSQRPGIVHRLDRDTSGVIVIAKNDSAHLNLASQFEQREVEKEYLAVVSPAPDRDRDWIDQPIGPHPYQREKMAIRQRHHAAREARTFFEVKRRVKRYGVLEVLPKTGRTHQIRVHLQHIGCPIVADKLYSGQDRIRLGDLGLLRPGQEDTVLMERQALHARRLKFRHPTSGQPLELTAPLPADLSALLAALEELDRS